jgi:carboxyl-terminal processing protease
MASNLIRSLGLVGAIAIIPAATASFASAEVDGMRQFDEFMTVFQQVRAQYVEKVDDKTLLRGAIDGMLSSLDPHSSYMDEKGFSALQTQTEGEYGGLGLSVVTEDGAVKVMTPMEDTPAFRAGIKSGDYITHVNGKLMYNVEIDEAVAAMKGQPGTKVTITIVRPGRDKPFDVTLTRAIIDLPAVKWEVKDGVGVINVNSFLSRTTTDEALSAMAAVEKSLGRPPLGYIIDLRSNGGGLLDQAVSLSDAFLERGEIVSQRGRQKNDIERFYANPGDAARGRPIIVLIDEGSASAAEIVAGALQDHRRALVMGQTSFGKGSVQSLLPMPQGTAIRLTTARYYTPSGKSVQEGGITPDIQVPQLSDPDYKTRPRMREADLRRHLINELKLEDDVVMEDGKPDPRFSMTAEELKKKGIEDFQLHYALQTISRLGRNAAAAAPAAKAGQAKAGTR